MSTRRSTSTPVRTRPSTVAAPVALTVDGATQLGERARWVRDVLLPRLRPHLVGPERDERDVAEFERLTAEAERLEELVATSAVLPAYDDDLVHVGRRVRLEMPDGERTWVRPVHPAEAFLDDERVSATSPVSRALVGARAGDVVTVDGPAGTWSCTVLEVEVEVVAPAGPAGATAARRRRASR